MPKLPGRLTFYIKYDHSLLDHILPLTFLKQGLHSKTVNWAEFPYSKARGLLRSFYTSIWDSCMEYPKSLRISGVQVSSQTAISSDTYTVTYRAEYEGKSVTVKQRRNSWAQTVETPHLACFFLILTTCQGPAQRDHDCEHIRTSPYHSLYRHNIRR